MVAGLVFDEVKECNEDEEEKQKEKLETQRVNDILKDVLQFGRTEIFKQDLTHLDMSDEKLTKILKKLDEQCQIFYDEKNEKVKIVQV